MKRGQYAEATRAARKAAELSGGSAEALATAAFAEAMAGRNEKARKLLGELTDRAQPRYVPSYAVAQVHLALGDKDRAFELLEKAFNDREALWYF